MNLHYTYKLLREAKQRPAAAERACVLCARRVVATHDCRPVITYEFCQCVRAATHTYGRAHIQTVCGARV